MFGHGDKKGHGHGMGHGHGHGHGHGMGHGHGHGHGKAITPATEGGEGANRGESKGYALIAVIYLLGLIMGALDMSIVNPARTVIQNTMSVNDALGVWVITIYTLAYAASIPIMGKLADRHGRKYIYIFCIFLFGLGSLLCGLSQMTNNFYLLLGSRVIQALGGGGIMPVATAEFGTAFPEEKRGMALGMVGMVYGLASILGPSIGSLILQVFGQTNWQYIFYVNVPICIFVVLLGLKKLPNHKADEVKPIDIPGIFVLTALTLSLMYGLKNIDFFDLSASITSTDVWPYILVGIVLMPVFLLIEKRAKDPIINPSYFTNLNIVVTLVCAIISGVIMMGTIFYPQFCENAMMMKSGSGGYFIALLGLGTSVGAMSSGKLIDQHGVKPVMALGFVGAAVASLFLAFVACRWSNLFTVCVTMVLSGLGMGFTMGTALNYMMLDNTDESESNSALATMSLVRSVGTAVAPAIMVAFIVHASSGLQDTLMDVMPQEVTVSPLPYAQELDDELEEMRSDEEMSKMLEGLDIPKLSDYTTMEVNMDGEGSDIDVEISDEVIQEFEDSDVTTVTEVCKDMAADVFSQVMPTLIEDAQGGIESGISTMKDKSKEMKDAIAEMDDGVVEIDDGIASLDDSIAEMNGKISDAASNIKTMDKKLKTMDKTIKKMDSGISEMKSGIKQMKAQVKSMSATMGSSAPAVTAMQGQIDEMQTQLSKLEKTRDKLKTARKKIKAARDGIATGKSGMEEGRSEMKNAQSEMRSGRTELIESRDELKEAYASLKETITKLEAVDEAIPGVFEEAQTNYLAAIDEKAPEIQSLYQKTLNEGFRGMALFVVGCAVLGLLLLIPYRDNRKAKREDDEAEVETPQLEESTEA